MADHNSSRAKLSFMRWYESDFWGLRVRKLHPMARLMYRSLLQQAWHCPTAPYLPAEPSELMVMADCPDKRTWEKHGPSVLSMFELTEHGYINDRQLREFDLAKTRSEKAHHNGRFGGRPEKPSGNQNETKPEPNRKQIESYQNQNQNQIPEPEAKQPADGFNSTECAKAVGVELGISDWKTHEEIRKQIEMRAAKSSEPFTKCAEHFISVGNAYKAAKPNLEYSYGWQKFFGQGICNEPEAAWPWKEGTQPRKESRGSDLDPMAAALLASERGKKLREENEARKSRFEVAAAAGGSQ